MSLHPELSRRLLPTEAIPAFAMEKAHNNSGHVTDVRGFNTLQPIPDLPVPGHDGPCSSFSNYNKQPQSTLCRLSGELRNRIYDYAMPEGNQIEVTSAPWTSAQAGVTMTCKLLRYETLATFYTLNQFTANISESPDAPIRWLNAIRPHNARHLRDFQITFTDFYTFQTHNTNLCRTLAECCASLRVCRDAVYFSDPELDADTIQDLFRGWPEWGQYPGTDLVPLCKLCNEIPTPETSSCEEQSPEDEDKCTPSPADGVHEDEAGQDVRSNHHVLCYSDVLEKNEEERLQAEVAHVQESIRCHSGHDKLDSFRAFPPAWQPTHASVVRPWDLPSAAQVAEDTVLKLSRITRLLPQHSQKCLDRVGGRINTALAAFEEAKAHLPPQAFIPLAMTRHLLLHPLPRLSVEHGENMILRVSLKTGMTVWWSIDCLCQTGWSEKLAVRAFNKICESLPHEAFAPASTMEEDESALQLPAGIDRNVAEQMILALATRMGVSVPTSQDHLRRNSWNIQQAMESFGAGTAEWSTAASAPPAAHLPSDLDPNTAVQLVNKLSKQTRLTPQYAELCLRETGWDYDKALEAFHSVCKTLPQKAFQSSTSTFTAAAVAPVRSSSIPVDLRCRKCQELAVGAVSRSCCKRPVCLTCSDKTRGSCIICNELLSPTGICTPEIILRARVKQWQIDRC